jgi:exopolysaccharide production protein ExoZ
VYLGTAASRGDAMGSLPPRGPLIVSTTNPLWVKQSKRKYCTLQGGRGIAALMVVFHHASIYFGLDPRYWKRPALYLSLRGMALGVEYFFVLSGAVILLAHWDDIDKRETIRAYIWKRFRRIYPIYWIVLSLVVAQYILRPSLGESYQRSAWVIISGYTLFHIHSLEVNLPVAWTLFHELLFYGIFAGFLFRRRLGYGLLTIWCCMSVAMCVYPSNRYLSVYLFSPLHLLFALGMLVTWLLRIRFSEGPRSAYVVTVLGLMLLGYTLFWSAEHGITSMSVQLVAGLGSGLIIYGTALLEEQGKLTVPASLQFFGDASYSLYIVHYPLFMFLAPFTYKVWLHMPVPVAIPFTFMVVSGTLAGCGLHVYVERPLLNYMSHVSSR